MEVSKVRRIPASSSNNPPKRNYSEHVSRTTFEDGSILLIFAERELETMATNTREYTTLTTGDINTKLKFNDETRIR